MPRLTGIRAAWLLLLAGAGGCAVTPLTNRIAVGEDAFVLGVGEGPDRMTDLFAAPASGGSFVRVTFTRPEERNPRLAPGGTAVAFFRRNAGGADSGWSLVVLDLKTTAERTAPFPGEVTPERLGWTRSGDTVVSRAGAYFALAVSGSEPLRPLPPARAAWADSVTRELLGTPATAMVRECADPAVGLCVVAADGEFSALEPGARDAIRWGADSIGYLTGQGYQVRPLAGGRARSPAWRDAPANLRQLTYHPGAPARADQPN